MIQMPPTIVPSPVHVPFDVWLRHPSNSRLLEWFTSEPGDVSFIPPELMTEWQE